MSNYDLVRTSKRLIKCKCPACGKKFTRRLYYTGPPVKYLLKNCDKFPGCKLRHEAFLENEESRAKHHYM